MDAQHPDEYWHVNSSWEAEKDGQHVEITSTDYRMRAYAWSGEFMHSYDAPGILGNQYQHTAKQYIDGHISVRVTCYTSEGIGEAVIYIPMSVG